MVPIAQLAEHQVVVLRVTGSSPVRHPNSPMVNEFEYKKPTENLDKVHKIELVIDGEVAGYADLEYRNDPFGFYYVQTVLIRKGFQGHGFGSEMLEKVNEFLDSKNKPGLLLDAVMEDESAAGVYERHGWVRIPGKKYWFGYNLENMEPGQVEKAIHVTRRRII